MTLPKSGRSPTRAAPAFQFYPADFVADDKVQPMDATDVGAYLLLLCAQWARGPLPDDQDWLRKTARVAPRAWPTVWAVVSPCFNRTEAGLLNPRLERERALQVAYREQQRVAGKLGAKTRWHGDAIPPPPPGDPPGMPGGMADGSSAVRSPQSTSSTHVQRQQLPAAGAAGPTAPKPRRAPSGPVQELLAWFRDEYERLRGSPYVIAARDGVAAAKALKAFDVAELHARLLRGLQLEDDGFIANSDRGLAFLLGQINRPSLRGLALAVTARGGAPSATAQVQTIAAVTERLIREEQRGQG